MSVKIRLQRHGRKQAPLYHIVVADARSPRDGSFIERLGLYNPMTRPATIEIDRMKAFEWLNNGAQPTDTVRAILRFKGVLYYKHLQRGVKKGALTAEDAETKFRAWVDEKESKIQARVAATAEERRQRNAEISGSKKSAQKKKVEEAPDELLTVDLAEQAEKEVAAEEAAAEATEMPEETPETPAEEENTAE